MNEEIARQQIEQMKNEAMSKILTKDALERLGRIRTANTQLAAQVELYLLQVYQTGKIIEKITDEKLKDVLKTLSEPKREFNMRRK
ncbi:MAG: DNA-binding protein [Candidatus Aenigmatarchaeota archaeon]|nr:DNA-binding protein [Nanoarchaeota archaeon]